QMCGDAPHFKKFLQMCRANVIGAAGLRLQVRAYSPDGKTLNIKVNKKIEAAFWDWGHRETCTLSTKMNWAESQRLFITQLARDGEVLVQKVYPKNGWGFALKFWNVDYLDESHNVTLPSGNRVIMSVEIDADDKPVAYWLTTPSPDTMIPKRQQPDRTRIAAEEMIHAFLINDDESQVRGLTWFHAGLLGGKSLYSYVEAVVTQARMTSMSLGIIEEDSELIDIDTGGLENDEGRERLPEIEFYPGGFTKLLPGQTLKQFDPKQPTQNHPAFKKSMEIDLAGSFGVHYFSLTGDMEAVNYSSARVGLGEERDLWRELQDFVAEVFCREVYHEWARCAMLAGKIKLTSREYNEIQNPMWRPRGWRYVDPLKEVNADVTAIENKLTSYTEVMADKGIDLIDHLETLKQEKAMFEEYGVEYGTVAIAEAAMAQADDPNADDPNAEMPPTEEKKKAAAGAVK
ncbi:MAG: phage portal protein, partial [Ilumatobacteraceae bacterium]